MALVDGRRIAYDSAGEGTPVVVLVAGSGADRTHFSAVFSKLSELSTVVAYDRSGYGESDAATPAADGLGWRTRELRGLLDALDASPPYVLVGHSLGALIGELFALEHSDDVLAVVSLDGDDGIPTDLPPWPEFPENVEREAAERLFANVPPEVRSRIMPPAPHHVPALIAEASDRDAGLDRLGRAARDGGLPSVAFVQVGATGHWFGPESLLPIDAATVVDKLNEKHERTAARYAGGRYVEAAASGHSVQFDEPELVVEAVRSVLPAGRS